jgi:tRNA pseudouridine55 synthase
MLLLDKPVGCTSNQALQTVKRLYGARKAGHTGSLDPLASGMLPICFGEATKISAYLLNADKTYQVSGVLGQTTTTGDAEGEVVRERSSINVDANIVRAGLQRFLGEIEQIPPMYSALHHQGKRLYELARQGLEVKRPARRVTIHDIEFLDLQSALLTFRMRCSKGTYVRTLVEDLGEALGCGAHVSALRRLATAPYRESEMISMATIEATAEDGIEALDELLITADSALVEWPQVQLNEDTTYQLRHGQPVFVPRAPVSGWVRIYAGDTSFLGVGEIDDHGRVAPRRMVQS